ncbi:uncharacterized protein H6S33_004504 [Morchella sextelata]|uniref:uncharacterized protein n=1 Tax=Morchella sextelata TaxID=1174677 RepID=UPI001D03FE99|nr:uncharacterized protein H6S33_004504 [Morchella sextelata]KAH0606047.1 hypothetical protein H6S33_004504 [Morchella sextelata]
MKFSIVLLASLTSLSSACIYPRAGDSSFTYEGAGGPLVWHHLNATTNGACAEGKTQSPINVDTKSDIATAVSTTLSYPAQGHFTSENNGHTLQYSPPKGSNFTATLGGKQYQLLQFHFHTPSEHRLNKEHFPLEVHFVHQNAADKSLAVVGVFFDVARGPGDGFLMGVQAGLKDVEEKGDEGTANIHLGSIIKKIAKSTVYNYKGSLTTPPCTEEINWFVVEEPLAVSIEQYKQMKKIMKFNSRFTQNELRHKENIIEDSCGAI